VAAAVAAVVDSTVAAVAESAAAVSALVVQVQKVQL
jgi:hypothetical protein